MVMFILYYLYSNIKGNFIILERRQKNRLDTLKRLRCMDVPIVAVVNIKQNVSINMMLKKM